MVILFLPYLDQITLNSFLSLLPVEEPKLPLPLYSEKEYATILRSLLDVLPQGQTIIEQLINPVPHVAF
jgi:hypothetical protein